MHISRAHFLFTAKQYVTTTTMTINEKEPNKKVSTWRSPSPEMTEKRNSMNDSVVEDDDRDGREHRLERAERQMREYAQNIENGRGARGKPMVSVFRNNFLTRFDTSFQGKNNLHLL